MKHLFVASSAVLFLAAISCAQTGPGTTTGSGGSASPGTGGSTTASGGTTATGGSSSGGSPGSGGNGNGTGGAMPGTGGESNGTGGVATGGAGPGTGGGNGTGGAVTGTGGRGAGGTNTGGVGTGGGSATGGAGGISAASVVPKLDGYLWIGTCASGAPSTGNATDCPIYPDGVSTCPNVNAADYATRGAIRPDTIPVLGTSGTTYTITMEVRGIAGGRCYNGGTRVPPLSSAPEGTTGNDGWQVGGTPIDSKWNTWEFHVYPPGSTTETAVYYLNAFAPTSIYCERHETFIMKYMATFPVQGGGMIKTIIHDSNCAGQQNCGGVNAQTTCANPRMVSLTGMDPQPPATFSQPPITNTYHPQWLFFDVKSVTSP